MRARLTALFDRIWYERSPLAILLFPVSWVYALALRVHRRRRSAARRSFEVPVIVVGNLTVGGTGKTPVVIWLARVLMKRGLRPGIVTRGYRGAAGNEPLWVDAGTDAALAGDEALLIARELRCPVVTCADRVVAVDALECSGDVDVVISDDGLQHFALRADCEVVIVDGARGLGNAKLLPAGPLREHPRRLDSVDVVLINGTGWSRPGAKRFELECTEVTQLSDGEARPLARWSGSNVHALAAIGNPGRFFAMLRAAGCSVVSHAWPDHEVIPASALQFDDQWPVLVTQKDAVKLQPPVRAGVWSVNVDVQFSSADAEFVIDRILEKIGRGTADE